MRKALFGLLICLLATNAWAVVKPTYLTLGGVDQTVTSSDTILVDANVYFRGATVGDKIDLRKGSSSGTIILTAVAATANQSIFVAPSEPIKVDGGIYMDMTLTTGAATSGINLIYQ